jgi:hypothetical protein
MFNAPGGRPASVRTWPSTQKHRGESSEPLKTTVLPAARAYMIARRPRIYGAFLCKISAMFKERCEKLYQGAIPKTTPYASFNMRALVPSAMQTGISPCNAEEILPEISLNISDVFDVLKVENASTAPVSFMIYSWHSDVRFSKSSAARSIMSRRKFGFDFDHAGNAASAAATASRASFLEADELDQSVSDVEGEMTGKVVDVMTSLPLMSRGTVKDLVVMVLDCRSVEGRIWLARLREMSIIYYCSRRCVARYLGYNSRILSVGCAFR